MSRTAARQQHRSRRKRLMPLSLGSLPFASLPPRPEDVKQPLLRGRHAPQSFLHPRRREHHCQLERTASPIAFAFLEIAFEDRKSTRLNSSHQIISYAVFCLKKKKNT